MRLLLVMVLWAACFPLIALGLGLAPHMAFATLRAALAGAGVLLLAWLLHRAPPRSARDWALVALTGLGATSLGFLGMFHAAEFVSPGFATVIANTQPLITAVLAYAVLRERLGLLAWLGLVLGVAGIAMVAWRGAGDAAGSWLGPAYLLVAATGVAVGNVCMKRLAGKVDALFATGLQLLIGAVPLLSWSLLTEDVTAIVWSVRFLVLLLVLALFGTGLSYWLWFSTLEEVELSRANALTFLVPGIALVIGAVFFQERLGWIEAVGVVLTVVGIAAVHAGSVTGTSRDGRAAGIGRVERESQRTGSCC